MKRASLLAAAGVILVANAFALVHAARNRSGDPDAEITLTDRELNYTRGSDDSGVELTLRWVDSNGYNFDLVENPGAWLNQGVLQNLGFDCSVVLTDSKAEMFYTRQRPRRAFVALEYDGPAWREWLAFRQESQRRMAEQQPGINYALDEEHQSSRLVTIDAAIDAHTMRARHPDRNRVVILPAVIRISLQPRVPAGQGRPERPARLSGFIQQTPPIIHVPLPLSDHFRRMPSTFRDPKQAAPLYRVSLRYGQFVEPWVTGAEFLRN